MGPFIKTLLTVNDRIYDLAVLVYSGAGLIAWAAPKRAGGRPLLPRLAKLSFVFFVLAGMPRMLTYHSFEWRSAVSSGQAETLLLKLCVLCLLAGLGTYAWLRAGKKG
ncbi:MAG: hypothetical protein M0Z75_02030 [Nitrospiraceae bacterium]|nr:hypothetical protein [Nitrospiraceae bacterium]